MSAGRLLFAAAVAAAVCAALGSTPASATDLTVTNCNGSGPGSLPAAVSAAASGDRIVFAQGCSGSESIAPAGGMTVSGKAVTIDADEHAVTIDGKGAIRPFTIRSGGTLTLAHVTVAHGNDRGIVIEDGSATLNLWYSTLSANHGGFGGAIENEGTANILRSTVTGNDASYGGAIDNDGTAVVEYSTLSANNGGFGGAINLRTGSVTLTNSTVSVNSGSFGGGIRIAGGTLAITNSTIAGNGAGFGGNITFAGGSTTFKNTIVANPSKGSNCDGQGTDGGYNLSSDSSCGFSSHEVIGNPRLGPLADNGGPTDTMALGEGSPAIGAANPDVCLAVGNFDQRHYARNTGGRGFRCDIGAYDTGGNVAGPASGVKTEITRSAATIVADGSSTLTITVLARDATDKRLHVGGDTVALETTRGTLGPVTDNHDGTYTSILTSSTTAGNALVSGTIDGQAIAETVGVGFVPGPPSGAKTTMTRKPSEIVANGTSTSTITVRAFDQFGNRINVGGATVTLHASAGTLGSVVDQGNGAYTAKLTSPTTTGKAKITGTIDGQAIGQAVGVQFVAGPPSGATTTIVRKPGTIPADGTSTSAITVHAYDQFGNKIKHGGATVTLHTTRGTLSVVTYGGDGDYRATLTSSNTPGTATVSGTINGQAITHTASVVFQ